MMVMLIHEIHVSTIIGGKDKLVRMLCLRLIRYLKQKGCLGFCHHKRSVSIQSHSHPLWLGALFSKEDLSLVAFQCIVEFPYPLKYFNTRNEFYILPWCGIYFYMEA